MTTSHSSNSAHTSFVIVGAGIIGISTAFRIAQLNPKADITIISKDFPDSGLLSPYYTSSKAGAHFRPFPSKNEYEARDSKFTKATYNHFKKLAKEHPETSIKFMKGIDYLEYDNKLYSTLAKGYTEVVDDFQVIPRGKLPKNVKFGASYETFCLNPHVYMNFMLDSLRLRQGIKLITKEVYSLHQVSQMYNDENPIIINCTGNGLLYDGSHDPACFAIRGQTLLVRPPLDQLDYFNSQTTTFQLANGEWCFTIPRPLNGGIILGGTKNEKSHDDTPIPEETEKLIANARSRFPGLFCPETGKLDIMRVNVGFRPARNSGVRLEREVLQTDKGNVVIVHCYGFAGSGVEMSWGAAEKAAELAMFSSTLSKL
jgi:D-amino-acid oxidase